MGGSRAVNVVAFFSFFAALEIHHGCAKVNHTYPPFFYFNCNLFGHDSALRSVSCKDRVRGLRCVEKALGKTERGEYVEKRICH